LITTVGEELIVTPVRPPLLLGPRPSLDSRANSRCERRDGAITPRIDEALRAASIKPVPEDPPRLAPGFPRARPGLSESEPDARTASGLAIVVARWLAVKIAPAALPDSSDRSTRGKAFIARVNPFGIGLFLEAPLARADPMNALSTEANL